MTSSDSLQPLARAAIEGDHLALAELVRATQPAVWRLCAALGSLDEEEEDLVQETYLRALRALPGFRFDCDVEVWLLAIGRRVCADHVRRRQRQRRLVVRLGRSDERVAGPESSSTADLLLRLPADRREAFVLTQVVGLTYDEAAIVAGCAVGTIRSRVSRAAADLLEWVRQAAAE